MGSCYNAAMKIKRRMDNAVKVYVSFSGGKDSTAMLLRLIELDVHIDGIMFADTGFEFPELYAYIDRIEKHIGRPITRLKLHDGEWEKWFYGETTRGVMKGQKRGFPLRAYPCYWSREAKVNQLERQYVDAKVIYIGIAKDEMERCSNDAFVKYPLIEWGWTEQDCVDYLNSKGLMNPLYTNFNRLGCFFCQKQSEMSLWVLWKTHPDLWEKAKYWDTKSREISGSGHGIKELPLIEYQKKFESGWIPRQEPKYECFKCDAVSSAFKIRQAKINNYFSGGVE